MSRERPEPAVGAVDRPCGEYLAGLEALAAEWESEQDSVAYDRLDDGTAPASHTA